MSSQEHPCECLATIADRNTECECVGPGFCRRHKCNKPEHFYNLCRTRPDYFALYEQGRGPGQFEATGKPGTPDPEILRPVGLGDVVAAILGRFGIQPWPGCGCAARKAWLNRFVVWGWWRAT